MSFHGVNPSIMRYEVRVVDPNRPPVRKVSKGAKFAAALGGFLGPVASALGFIFPPLFAVGAAAYAGGALAKSKMAQQQAHIQAEQAAYQQRGPQMISYMGYDPSPMQMQPVAMSHPGVAPQADPVMEVLFLRNQAPLGVIQATNFQGK